MSKVRLEPMTAAQFAEFMELILPPRTSPRARLPTTFRWTRRRALRATSTPGYCQRGHAHQVIISNPLLRPLPWSLSAAFGSTSTPRRSRPFSTTSPSFPSGIAAVMRRRHSPWSKQPFAPLAARSWRSTCLPRIRQRRSFTSRPDTIEFRAT